MWRLLCVLPWAVLGDDRAFCAQAALAALQDVQRQEQQILEDERSRITGGVGPLEIHGFVHEALGLFLDASLAAVRYAVAAEPLADYMVEASALEKQLKEILSAHFKEPLFFWHGPKWMIRSKLQRLFGQGPWHEKLKALAALPHQGPPQEELDAPSQRQGPIPAVGLVLDDGFCPEGGCDLKELNALKTLKDVSSVHLLLLPCPEAALQRIAAALPSTPLYISASVPAEVLEAVEGTEATHPDGVAKYLEDYISSIEKVLKRPLDLVWLPYAAFKKTFWAGTQRMLNKPHKWAYGIHAEVIQPSVAKKLLDRNPKPSAWLSFDDILRPMPQEAVKTALNLGISCVSLPRKQVSSELTKLYLPGGQVTQMAWAWHRGLTASLRLPVDLTGQAGSMNLQSAAYAADFGDLVKGPATLYDGRQALQKAEAESKSLPPSNYKDTGVFYPGVSAKTLTGLEQQAKTFKANDHIIYAEDFFDEATFALIKEETQRLWRSEDIEANCNLDGTNRLGGYITDLLPHNSSLYHLIYGNDAFRQWVSAVNAEGPMWPSDFPIELREYGRDSKGMGCHPDLQMYKVERKDLEFAFTVDNDSRCNVTFYDATGKKHLVQTKANSLMMVGVNAATHCVSSTAGGTRAILKFIYVGDYRKSNEFWHYTSNECDETNPNRQMLDDRRAQRLREVRSSEL